jgi:hypothetical protein
MSRRDSTLPPFYRAVAAAGAALVLVLTVLAVCPTLHAWLHGEKQVDADDDCAVVLFAQGVTPALAAVVAVVAALRVLAEKLPDPARVFLAAPDFQFPPTCGPPF